MKSKKVYYIFISLCILVISGLSFSQDVATNEIYYRVFKIKYHSMTGSSFTIDVDGRQYLITAKHILRSAKSFDTIQVFHDHQWKDMPVQIFVSNNDSIDIAVIVLPVQISPSKPVVGATANGMAGGQDAYFAGFPFGLMALEGQEIELNAGYPLALVKRGTISAVVKKGEYSIIYVDGHLNRGFSGGPLVFRSLFTKENQFAGVISSYLTERDTIISHRNDTLRDTVYSNAGLFKVFMINAAIDIIRKHPVGVIISDTTKGK